MQPIAFIMMDMATMNVMVLTKVYLFTWGLAEVELRRVGYALIQH
jgi:hypothetical protein